jgi:hypothetical protein
MTRPGARRACAAAMAALTACAYNSDYVPPVDGRARVVAIDGTAQALVPAQPSCVEALESALEAGALPVPEPVLAPAPGTYVEVVLSEPDPGHAPHLRAHGPPVHPHPRVHPSRPVHAARPAARHSAGRAAVSSMSENENLAIVAAVMALVTLPVVAVALASAQPGNASEIADAIDRVNAFNDLSRLAGSPCAPPLAPPPPPPLPADAPSPPVPAAREEPPLSPAAPALSPAPTAEGVP